jgi:hypothetical protein
LSISADSSSRAIADSADLNPSPQIEADSAVTTDFAVSVVPARSDTPSDLISASSPAASQHPSSDTSLPQALPTTEEPNSSHIVTRSMTGSLKPTNFPDFHLYHSLKSTKHPLKDMFLAALSQEPSTF